MGGTILCKTVKANDLGDNKCKHDSFRTNRIAASQGNQIIGVILRNVTYKGKELSIPMCKAIVRPY